MSRHLSFALSLCSLLLASAGQAQDVAQKSALTLEGARRAIAAAVADARSKGTTGAIAVVDEGGNLMALERLDGTFAAGARISTGKARTAVLFKKPTRFFEELINKGRTAMSGLDDFTPLIGGVPLVVGGQVVGGIGVSGAASAAQDEELALAGAAALAGEPKAVSLQPTQYLPAADVKGAFEKGRPLLANDNYQVHASHRDGPGKVEVHTKDTDVFYVLKGTATLVTGGTMVGGSGTEPDELRGASIDGGETRHLVPGDVVVVPRGVPHWFKAVPGPIDYFAVKVR